MMQQSATTKAQIKPLYPVQIERQVPVGTKIRVGKATFTKLDVGWLASYGRVISSETLSCIL